MSIRAEMRRALGEDGHAALWDEALERAGTFDVDMRPINRDDVVACHQLLDELDVPRLCDAGEPLSLRWRLTHLVAVSKRGVS